MFKQKILVNKLNQFTNKKILNLFMPKRLLKMKIMSNKKLNIFLNIKLQIYQKLNLNCKMRLIIMNFQVYKFKMMNQLIYFKRDNL